MFDVGDKVRVKHDLKYFSTVGQEMIVLERKDHSEGSYYKTDKPCPVYGPYYCDFELDILEDVK